MTCSHVFPWGQQCDRRATHGDRCFYHDPESIRRRHELALAGKARVKAEQAEKQKWLEAALAHRLEHDA